MWDILRTRYSIIIALCAATLAQVSAKTPPIRCGGLPGCGDDGIKAGADSDSAYNIIGNAISLMIQYTAVLAVIAVMIGGIMYLLSGGDEEKISKAKRLIIWALVGVIVSVLAYSVIEILNNFVIS